MKLKLYKKCTCGCYYFLLDLPKPLAKPEGHNDGYDYFNCESCHSTFIIKMAVIQLLKLKAQTV